MSKRARGGEEMSEEPTASCGHAFDVWYGFGVCPECHNELLARVKVLEELAAALDDLLCAYRVGGQEWGARAADRVSRARAEKRIIAARAALRGEEQGK
jgi:hypothetical protein